MAHQIDAPVQAVKPAVTQAMGDGSPAEPRRQQLLASDEPPLGGGDPCDVRIRAVRIRGLLSVRFSGCVRFVRLEGPIPPPGDFDTSCVHGPHFGLGGAARPTFCTPRGGHDPQFEAADLRVGEVGGDLSLFFARLSPSVRSCCHRCGSVAIGCRSPPAQNDESRPRAALVVLFFQRRLPAARASTSA